MTIIILVHLYDYRTQCRVGGVFCSFAHYLKMYAVYLNNVEPCRRLLTQLARRSQDFNDFIKQFEVCAWFLHWLSIRSNGWCVHFVVYSVKLTYTTVKDKGRAECRGGGLQFGSGTDLMSLLAIRLVVIVLLLLWPTSSKKPNAASFQTRSEWYLAGLMVSDFWCDVILSRWRPWHHFTQKSAVIGWMQTHCPPGGRCCICSPLAILSTVPGP